MNESQINRKLSSLLRNMVDKGMVKPDVSLTLEAEGRVYVATKWDDKSKSYGYDYKHTYGKSASEAIQLAFDHVEAQPCAKERNFTEFMNVLAQAVDCGRENGIDVEYINPLQETMKRLSENAITFQGAA